MGLRQSVAGYQVDAELLREILYVYCARRERQRGLTIFDSIVTLFPDPVTITSAEMGVARHLIERYDALIPRDAIHAAVVLVHGMEGIVSADRIFDQIDSVRRFDPVDDF